MNMNTKTNTMNAKHTPGPWHHGRLAVGTELVSHPDAWRPDVRDSSKRVVCKCSSREESAANACLIAAAPELLAALENLVQADDAHAQAGLNGNTSAQLEATMMLVKAKKLARAAIAKAKGHQ